jgi:hypothetical protein
MVIFDLARSSTKDKAKSKKEKGKSCPPEGGRYKSGEYENDKIWSTWVRHRLRLIEGAPAYWTRGKMLTGSCTCLRNLRYARFENTSEN